MYGFFNRKSRDNEKKSVRNSSGSIYIYMREYIKNLCLIWVDSKLFVIDFI